MSLQGVSREYGLGGAARRDVGSATSAHFRLFAADATSRNFSDMFDFLSLYAGFRDNTADMSDLLSPRSDQGPGK